MAKKKENASKPIQSAVAKIATVTKGLHSYPGVKIIHCNCNHEDQDKMYGKGMRLHNRVEAKGKFVGYACTVCTPRRLNCDKGAGSDPQPAFGMKVSIPGPKPRFLKHG